MRYLSRPGQKRHYLRKLSLSMFAGTGLLIVLFGGIVVNRSIRALRNDYDAFARQLLASVSSSSESRYRSAMSLVTGALWQSGTISNFMYASVYDALEEQKALNELRLQMVHNDAVHSVYFYNRQTGVFSSVEPVYGERGPVEETYLQFLNDGFEGFSRAIALTAYDSEMRTVRRQLISFIAKDVWWPDTPVNRAVIINMDEEAFLRSIGAGATDAFGQLFVIGRDGVVLAATDQTYFGQDFSVYGAARRAATDPALSGTFESETQAFLGDTTYFISYMRSRTLGWTFLHATDSRRLRAEYYGVLTSTLLILFPILVLGVVVALGLAQRLYDPIARMITRIQHEHPDLQAHERTLGDLEYIEASIDDMATEIRALSDRALHGLDAEVSQLTQHALAGTMTTAESEQLSSHVGRRFPVLPVVVATVAVDLRDDSRNGAAVGRAFAIDHLRFLSTIRAWASRYEGMLALEHLPLHARLVIPQPHHAEMPSVRSVADELLASLNSGEDASYSVAISEPVGSVEDLHEAAEVTDDLLRFRRLLGRRQLLSPRDIEFDRAEDFAYPAEIEHQLIAAVRAGRQQEFIAATGELFAYLEQRDVELFEYTATQVLLNVIREMNEVLRRGKAGSLVGYDEVGRLARCMGVTEHAAQYAAVFSVFLDKYSIIPRRTSTRSEIAVSEIRRVVASNLSNHNLDLTLIAGELNLSPNYLSRLFKDETGGNLTTYIRDARMELACKLLVTNRQLSIPDVATECGYADVNYFSYSFRASMGMAPSVYRASEGDGR